MLGERAWEIELGYPLIGSWNPNNRPSSGGGGVILVCFRAWPPTRSTQPETKAPECVAARVLLTGATVFAAKFECGLDAVGMAWTTQQRGAASSPAPALTQACPCTHGRYVGGEVLDPNAYVWTWALDGREHRLAERPVGESDEQAVKQMQEWGGSDPQKKQLAKNMLSAWGINRRQLEW